MGWVLHGPVRDDVVQRSSVNMTTAHVLLTQSEQVPLQAQLRKFWEVEDLEDPRAGAFDSKAFVNEIERRDDRYYVPSTDCSGDER